MKTVSCQKLDITSQMISLIDGSDLALSLLHE